MSLFRKSKKVKTDKDKRSFSNTQTDTSNSEATAKQNEDTKESSNEYLIPYLTNTILAYTISSVDDYLKWVVESIKDVDDPIISIESVYDHDALTKSLDNIQKRFVHTDMPDDYLEDVNDSVSAVSKNNKIEVKIL